jgi:hypothetical protein
MGDRSRILLRFVLPRSQPDTGVEEGIFSTAYRLREAANTRATDRRLLDTLLSWFGSNLPVPMRFNRTTSKGYYRRRTQGVSWLRLSAAEHVAKMRELAAILEKYGYRVAEITTDRPGYVVFEDDHQVVAEPFRDTRCRPPA